MEVNSMWSIHWKYLGQLAIKYTKKDQDDALKPLYSGLHTNKKVDSKLQPNVWWFTYADAYQGNAHGTSWATQLYS